MIHIERDAMARPRQRMSIPFNRSFEAPYEELVSVSPRIRRLLTNNPGPFTFKGTSVAVIGQGHVAVVDPGPDNPAHLAALRNALSGETVTHILVTHTHCDHSPAAKFLKQWTGAKTYGFGPHGSGKPNEGPPVEEGGDADFVPDIVLRDGDEIEDRGFAFSAI